MVYRLKRLFGERGLGAMLTPLLKGAAPKAQALPWSSKLAEARPLSTPRAQAWTQPRGGERGTRMQEIKPLGPQKIDGTIGISGDRGAG